MPRPARPGLVPGNPRQRHPRKGRARLRRRPHTRVRRVRGARPGRALRASPTARRCHPRGPAAARARRGVPPSGPARLGLRAPHPAARPRGRAQRHDARTPPRVRVPLPRLNRRIIHPYRTHCQPQILSSPARRPPPQRRAPERPGTRSTRARPRRGQPPGVTRPWTRHPSGVRPSHGGRR